MSRNALFRIFDQAGLQSGYTNIVTFSVHYECLAFCLSLKACKSVNIMVLSEDEVSCAVYDWIPSNGYQGDNTAWQLYIMDEN